MPVYPHPVPAVCNPEVFGFEATSGACTSSCYTCMAANCRPNRIMNGNFPGAKPVLLFLT